MTIQEYIEQIRLAQEASAIKQGRAMVMYTDASRRNDGRMCQQMRDIMHTELDVCLDNLGALHAMARKHGLISST